MNILISIIIPVYNAEENIRRCVDSILRQTYANYEVILVDDGSTDTSGKICDEYASAHANIHVFHIPNHGVSHARNYGIQKSSGQYVTFVDSDDFLSETALELLARGKGILTYFSIGQYNLDTSQYEQEITHLETTDISLGNKNDVEKIGQMDLLAVGYPYGKLFDMDVIKKNNLHFDERIKNHEDHIFCFDYLLCVNDVHVEKQVGYYWTYKSKSSSLSHLTPPYENMLIASDAFMERYERLFMKLPFLPQKYKDRMTAEYGMGTRRAAIYSLYHNKEDKATRKSFFKEQTGIYAKLLTKYGYHTPFLKHKLVYIFASIKWIPFAVKDFLFCKLYEK